MSGESNPGCAIAGFFLVLFGLCITLVGGGCTLLLLSMVSSASLGDAIPLLLVSLLVLAGGIFAIWGGIKLMRGGGGG